MLSTSYVLHVHLYPTRPKMTTATSVYSEMGVTSWLEKVGNDIKELA